MIAPLALAAWLILSAAGPAALPSQAATAQQQPAEPPIVWTKHAPLAQAIVLRTQAAHPEIQRLGLHAVPPDSTDNVILGSVMPSRLGSKSSEKDARNLATGGPTAARVDKNSAFDCLFPLTDSKGNSLGDGFVVMAIPYTTAPDEAAAIRIGSAIRDEMQRQIPSRDALYQ